MCNKPSQLNMCIAVNEVGDTDADREARALLNKFLGASVILQGMEQGMRGTNGTGGPHDDTPGSAALVSSVEKKRLVSQVILIIV